MKSFVMMLMAVFLFSVTSIKAMPNDEDVGNCFVKTDLNDGYYICNLPATAPDISFCQRTDMNDISSVIVSCDVHALEFIWPICENNYIITKKKISPCRQYKSNKEKDIGNNDILLPYFT